MKRLVYAVLMPLCAFILWALTYEMSQSLFSVFDKLEAGMILLLLCIGALVAAWFGFASAGGRGKLLSVFLAAAMADLVFTVKLGIPGATPNTASMHVVHLMLGYTVLLFVFALVRWARDGNPHHAQESQ